MHDDEELLRQVQERFGVPPALLDRARRTCVRTGRRLGAVLVEMGVLSSEEGDDVDTIRPGHTLIDPRLLDGDPGDTFVTEPPRFAVRAALADLPSLPGHPTDAPTNLAGAPPPQPEAFEDLETPTRIGDSVAETEAVRRLRAVEIATAHEEWLPHVADPQERYTLGNEIARGGMGRIVEAFDRSLGRTVAMKLMIGGADEQLAMQMRFTEEAQITGQLEHPNIVPVHDLGVDAEGQLYFTMKRVRGRTLRAALKAVRRDEPEARHLFPLHRLLNHFKQMCLAIAYAHSRGVVHRDLKPSNVMFGDFGEVLIMDWGLAKILPAAGAGKVHSLREGKRRWATRHGEVIGTPGYMPPELALGQLDDVDARSDVYSLGALLYEILTLQPPWAGGESREVLRRQLKEQLTPPRERAPDRDIPPPLEAICMRCLEREMEKRYPSALALHDDIDRFLAGHLEAAQKSETAGRFLAEAADHAENWRRANAKLRRLSDEVLNRQAALPPSATIEEYRPLWDGQNTLKLIGAARDRAFSQAEQGYRLALAADDSSVEARRGLADLYADALLDAEHLEDEGAYQRHADRLLGVAPQRHAALVQGPARLIVRTDPVGARVTLLTVGTRDGLYVAGDPQSLGVSPAHIEPIQPGRYQVILKARGYKAVHVPVRLKRGRERVVDVRLLRDEAAPPGTVHLPRGVYHIGGDLDALSPLPAQAVTVPDLAVMRLPVSCRQYLEFINAIAADDLLGARARCPRMYPGCPSLFTHRDGRFDLPTHAPDGGDFEGNWPIFGISAADAEAYAAWLAARDGVAWRLPTEHEWEVAARGGDGRSFVWGERWAPILAKCAVARPGMPRLEPMGAYAHDRSPFGVMDLAGGVADWTSSTFAGDPQIRACRGGTYLSGAVHARAATRFAVDASASMPWLGFRLVCTP